MIELIINGQTAVLPEDFSGELVFENPYFTKTSNYSLDIELPMPANNHIYKNIHRIYTDKSKLIYPAVLRDFRGDIINGSAVLLSVDDCSVNIQLVSGNAEFNMLTNDSIYIDEMDLGEAPHPNYATEDHGVLWLPVLYKDDLYNRSVWGKDSYGFTPRRFDDLCLQPYLHIMVKKVIAYLGYTFDDSFFTDNWMRYLYICSAVKTEFYAHALPHWTVSEFFEELEKFLCMVVIVDERSKVVRFVDLSKYFSSSSHIVIDHADIVDTYETEIDQDANDKDLAENNILLGLPSGCFTPSMKLDREWYDKIYHSEFTTYADLEAYWKGDSIRGKENTLFTAEGRDYVHWHENGEDSLKEVNLYSDLIRNDEEETKETTLKISPAKIESYNLGTYMNSADFNSDKKLTSLSLNVPSVNYFRDREDATKLNLQEAIEDSSKVSNTSGKNSLMEVALYTGKSHLYVNIPLYAQFHNDFAIPFMDCKQTVKWQESEFPNYSLSLNDVCEDSLGHRFRNLNNVNTKNPFTIYFTAKRIPDPKKVFIIGNQKYVCDHININFSKSKIEPIYEGTFYRID